MTTSTGIQQFDNRHSQQFDLVLNCHGIRGNNYNYQGYADLHGLYLVNQVFSQQPWGELVDRTGQTAYPFKLHTRKPWKGPLRDHDLATACELSVKQIISQNPAPYYIYWSGGIDSTLVLVSFLTHADRNDIKVCCSAASLDENLYFYQHCIKDRVEIFDSNFELPIDGTHVTGDCGDTIWATLDEGFFTMPQVREQFYQPWQSWFVNKNTAQDWRSSTGLTFIEYCEEFFSRSGKPINTLFEARWWFYLICKTQSKALYKTTGSFSMLPDLRLIHFFENEYMDSWSWYNTDRMIHGYDWQSYKWPAKELIFNYDGNEEYKKYKTKGYSSGLEFHRLLKNLSSIKHMPLFITDNNERPVLPTQPFFSPTLYKEIYFDRYKHLFEIQKTPGIAPGAC